MPADSEQSRKIQGVERRPDQRRGSASRRRAVGAVMKQGKGGAEIGGGIGPHDQFRVHDSRNRIQQTNQDCRRGHACQSCLYFLRIVHEMPENRKDLKDNAFILQVLRFC